MQFLRTILTLAAHRLRILSKLRAVMIVLIIPGIVLYSVFTLIFSGPAGRPFRVAVVDQDNTAASAALIDMLAANNVKVIRHEDEKPDAPLLTEESAGRAIRDKGRFRVAVVIPKGYALAPNAMSGIRHQGVGLLYDETQAMEADVATGMLQMAAGRAVFEKMFNADGNATENGEEKRPATLIKINRRGVAIERMMVASKHTFLAGIVPMFILFGSTGAARSLLDAIESGEMRRLLAAPIMPSQILMGQWLSAIFVLLVQCYAMYVYAWAVFGVTIWTITSPLFVLTLTTCMAAASVGMLIAAFCKTGDQLDAVGTMVILAMSAIGGSMVPRFIMPDFMRTLGLFTINGWSYDGFTSLIRNEGFAGIFMPCLVLTGTAIVLGTIASRIFAQRLRT